MTYDIFPTLVAILLMTAFCFNIFRLIYRSKISRPTLYFFYCSYLLLFIYLLFFKSIGVKGFNWNLFSTFTQDLFLNPAVLVFNLLLFLPLGLLVPFSWKKLTLFIGAILIIEVCQYTFSLGFFDLVDILLNTIGFVLGNFIGRSVIGRFFKNIVIWISFDTSSLSPCRTLVQPASQLLVWKLIHSTIKFKKNKSG